MLFNSLKLTLRQLWRNRLFTTLNVLGLSIGLAACWMIFQLVNYEFSFDAKQPNVERIYKVVANFDRGDEKSGSAGTPKPMADGIRNEIGGVEMVVGLYRQSVPSMQVPQSSGKPVVFKNPKRVIATTSDYFSLVPYQWLAGTPAETLTEPNEVVLTQTSAEKYFPNLTPEQMLGKSILYWDTLAVKVTGVVADLDYPSSFTGEEFLSLPTVQRGPVAERFLSDWVSTTTNDQIYVLKEEKTDAAQLAKNIDAFAYKKSEALLAELGSTPSEHELIPLSEEHFNSFYKAYNRVADKKVLFSLLGLAGFLLALAVINYVNLTTAQIPQRAKEIGIRKTLGSSRRRLISQFLGETFLVTLLACLLAYGWTILFRSELGDLFPTGLDLFPNIRQTLGFMSLLMVGVSVLAGWYPSLLITRFQPTQVLRGQSSLKFGKNSFSLRKSLIVFQFVIAQAFVIGAIIVNQQLRFALEKDLGFEKEAVLTFQVPDELMENDAYAEKHFALKEELKSLAEVDEGELGRHTFQSIVLRQSHQVQRPQRRGGAGYVQEVCRYGYAGHLRHKARRGAQSATQ